ncbi:MAG: BatD family protein [Thermoguttaceae bacterium]
MFSLLKHIPVCILILILGIIVPSVFGESDPVKYEAKIFPSEIFEGESAQLVLSITNLDIDQSPDLSSLKEDFDVVELPPTKRSDVKISNYGSQVNRIETRVIDYNYTLKPKRSGVLNIAPPEIETNGQKLIADPVALKVKEKSQTDLVYLELASNHPAKLYPLVPVEIVLNVFIKQFPGKFAERDPLDVIVENLEEPRLTIPWLESKAIGKNIYGHESLEDWLNGYFSEKSGFAINNYRLSSNPFDFPFSFFSDSRRETYFHPKAKIVNRIDSTGASTPYWEYSFRKKFTPLNAGSYVFPEATLKGNFIDFTSPDQPVATPIYLSTSPLTLEVTPIPEENAPNNYVGVYGKIEQKTSLSSAKVTVGEAVKLTISYTGYGVFDSAAPLDLSADPQIAKYFKVYKPEERSLESGVAFDYTLRPIQPFHGEIATIRSSYFNVESGTFEELESQLGDLEIEVGPASDAPIVSSDQTIDSKKSSSTLDQAPPSSPRLKRIYIVVLSLLLLILSLIGGIILSVKHRKKINLSAAQILRHVQPILEAGIAKFENSPTESLLLIRKAFLFLVAQKLPHSLESLTDAEILDFLSKEFQSEINNSPKNALLIKDLCDFFQLAEKIRFSDSRENIADFAERTRALFKSWTSLLQEKYVHIPSGSLSDLSCQQKIS